MLLRRVPFLLVFLFFMAPGKAEPDEQTLVLEHVTVIDATGAPAKPDMTVVVSGGRIARVEKSAGASVPGNAQVVEGRGKFVIPGLWDMHVHPGSKEELPLFIANGVTGIRVMWGSPTDFDRRREVEAGETVGPRMLIASAIVDGPTAFWPYSVSVKDTKQARQVVDDFKRQGADFVKVYQGLTRDEYFAIADEAKKQGIPFEGHVPIAVSAEEASAAGQKSFEHLFGILPACSTHSEEILKAQQADLAEEIASGKPKFWGPNGKRMRQIMLDTYSPEKAAALAAVLKKNGTWQCPTLTLLRMLGVKDEPETRSDPRLKYVPVRMVASWEGTKIDGGLSAEDIAFFRSAFRKDLEVVGLMQKAGVLILAGTDTGNPYCFSGFSLHDELGLLLNAGLTPMEALEAATRNAARFSGRDQDLGTVEQGKIADLVVLDANPLEDIGNTRKISMVVFGGKPYRRAALDQMLAQVESFARRKPIGPVLFATLQEKNAAAAVRQYHELQAAQPGAFDFGEDELIRLGYQLVGMKKYQEAIEIFRLSVEQFPESFNTWDSLAEAYMDNGDKELAIQNYRKSLQVNPQNVNAAEKLKELGAP